MIQKITIDDGDSDSYYKASDGIQVYEQYYKNVILRFYLKHIYHHVRKSKTIEVSHFSSTLLLLLLLPVASLVHPPPQKPESTRQ